MCKDRLVFLITTLFASIMGMTGCEFAKHFYKDLEHKNSYDSLSGEYLSESKSRAKVIVKEMVLNEFLKNGKKEKIASMAREPLPSNAIIQTSAEAIISPPGLNWAVLIEEVSEQNVGESFRYLFLDYGTGTVTLEKRGSSPKDPTLFDEMIIGFFVNKGRAKKIVINEILTEEDRKRTDVSMFSTPLAPGTVIPIDKDENVISPPMVCWFILIDDDPTANLGHPFRFVFIDCQTGEYTIVHTRYPPHGRWHFEVIIGNYLLPPGGNYSGDE